MSLRGRLVAASLALLAAALLVADAATFLALRSFLDRQVDTQLREAVESVERSPYLQDDGRPRPGGSRDHDRDRRGVDPYAFASAPGAWIQRRSADGTVLETIEGNGIDGSTPALPDALPDPDNDTGATVDDNGHRGVTFSTGSVEPAGSRFRVRISEDASGNVTIIALPLDGEGDTLRQLLLIEAIVTIGVLLASGVGGLWLVRLGLRPLDAIEDTAAHIAAGDLSRRVERADDRTEVGRLGASLNEMLGQIETAFAERQASEEALRASEARLRRFVADASHELRTPLAAVQAYAELFDRAAAEHPEDLPRMLHNIQKEAGRMGVLVEDLLLLTRLDQGRPLEQAPVDLGAVAQEAVDAATVLEPDRPVTLTVDGSVEVVGDRTRLRQILDNLLGNARIHTPAGTPLAVTVGADDADAVLRVVDHGPGLDGEAAAQVFERFFRADPSRSRADGGSGLGLSIVQAIARAHGGDATYEPTPGGGATFVVTVPLLHQPTTAEPPDGDGDRDLDLDVDPDHPTGRPPAPDPPPSPEGALTP